MSQYLTHRHPDHWVRPERFEPERFGSGATGERAPCCYFLFGAGPRRCIGADFATMEMVTVIAMLSRQFTLMRVGTDPIRPEPTVTLRPGGP